MDVFRTPDERFENLPGFPYEPNYVEVDGLRLHHVDEGSGPTVLCFHGEPSWSYLYRHMVDRLVGEGHRVVCPDLVGFGRSDKPTDQAWYTYDRHVETVSAHLDQIELDEVTVVVQDWGGPIGLRWAVEHADRVGRLVVLTPEDPGVPEMQATRDALSRWDKPALIAFSDTDPVFPFPKAGQQFVDMIPTAGEQVRIEGAAHFLQEDRGREIADAMLTAFGA